MTDIAQLAGSRARGCKQSECRHNFTVDGLDYEFTATNGGAVTFRVIGGATKLKAFTGGSWLAGDEDIVQFRDGGYFRTGRPLLRRVVALLAEWIHIEKPFAFHFHAIDERRHRIFSQMVRRHSPSLAGNYTQYLDGKEFWFVRKQDEHRIDAD